MTFVSSLCFAAREKVLVVSWVKELALQEEKLSIARSEAVGLSKGTVSLERRRGEAWSGLPVLISRGSVAAPASPERTWASPILVLAGWLYPFVLKAARKPAPLSLLPGGSREVGIRLPG